MRRPNVSRRRRTYSWNGKTGERKLESDTTSRGYRGRGGAFVPVSKARQRQQRQQRRIAGADRIARKRAEAARGAGMNRNMDRTMRTPRMRRPARCIATRR